MPRHHRIDIVALIVTLFCTLGLAAPAEKPIDRLLDLSGVTKQVGEMPEQVKAGFIQGVQQGNPIPETIALLVLHGADKTILPSVVLDEIRVSVENALTPGEIRTLLSWYESDVGKRITTAEEKASTPEAYTEMLQDAQSLLGQTGRVEVAERLDALLGATELYMDLQEFSSTASYTAMMSVMAPEEPLNLEAFNAQWDAMAPQMRESTRQLVIVSFVYAYRTIDEKSLGEYEAFLKSDAARKFNAAATKGLSLGCEKVIADWSHYVATVLKESVKENKKPKA